MNLNRFLEAQEVTYKKALQEIKNGKKQSHWMWYVFPQYIGLGKSSTSIRFAINNLEEANEYLNHSILGTRLIEICTELLYIEHKSVYNIFGSPDDLKLQSSMTLFNSIINEYNVFYLVLQKFYNSQLCNLTMTAISKDPKRHEYCRFYT